MLPRLCPFCEQQFIPTTKSEKDFRQIYCTPKCRWRMGRQLHPRPQRVARRYLAANRLRVRKLREEVIEHYGGKCARCGFSDYRALQIDCVNGDGYKVHKRYNSATLPTYIKRMGYPATFQVLCANCNWIKRVENHESKGRIH